jgi:heat shock protein HslJ
MRCGRITTGLVVSLFAASGGPTIGASADSPPLDGTAWTLTSLGGRTPPTGTTATARFEGSRVQGTNGCNRYSAPVVIQGTKVEVSPNAATTNMACPPDIMKLADAFMTALVSARSYRISSHQLDLLGADGTVLATFSAQSQSLAGSSWHVTGLNNGRGGVVSLVAGTSVTMNFATGGKVAGSGGCNNYTSTYTQVGGKLTFTPAAATRRMCAASGVMEQEHAFLKALESAATARVEGNELELRTADGALALSLVRNPEPD